MTVEVTEFRKGAHVVATRDFNSYYHWEPIIQQGTPGIVTSVRSKNSRSVKFDGQNYVSDIYLPDSKIALADPEMVAKLEAEKAEAEKAFRPQEGDILPDDPRLAWLWRAAAREANRSNRCGEYDQFCDVLGIPGRERDFAITLYVSGLKLTTTVTAQSKLLAEQKALETVPNSSLTGLMG